MDDGQTPDPNIARGITHDRFWPELGAPGPLVWNWIKNGKQLKGNAKQRFWDENFEPQFIEYLQEEAPSKRLRDLSKFARKGIATILCKEQDDRFCHRRLVGEEMLRRFPDIVVVRASHLQVEEE
jgi:uncharacterized protein (DUF488 family)